MIVVGQRVQAGCPTCALIPKSPIPHPLPDPARPPRCDPSLQANRAANNYRVRCAVEMIDAVATVVNRPLEYVLAISRNYNKVNQPATFWSAIDAAVGRAPAPNDIFVGGISTEFDPTLQGVAAPNADIDVQFVGMRGGLLLLRKHQFMTRP